MGLLHCESELNRQPPLHFSAVLLMMLPFRMSSSLLLIFSLGISSFEEATPGSVIIPYHNGPEAWIRLLTQTLMQPRDPISISQSP